ncbi:hypothetical protein RMCBS344292_14727 [Rhizopus microsporus]|nr:hypothetical protein RMCBS344292_14727 [Rhizopus microsporus]
MSPEQSLKRALGSLTGQTSKKPRNYEREDNGAINVEEQATTDSNRNATVRNGEFSKVKHQEVESRTVVIVSDLEDEDDTESEDASTKEGCLYIHQFQKIYLLYLHYFMNRRN